MNKLGEINFENRPSRYPAFVEDVRKICGTKEIVFGLEDTRGFGRNLAAYLVGRKFEVKHVNPAYTAYCVARVLRDMVDTLQDAKHEDIFWTIRQMVKRRDLIVKSNVMNKNQLHSQLAYSYPSYRKFFAMVDSKSALCFWENYPSPEYIWNTTPEEIYQTIKPVHQALKIQRIHEIISMIERDGDTRKNIVKDIRHNKELIAEIDDELRKLIPLTGYKLHTMPGIDLVTEAQIISEIGDINRFPDSDKLARFMGLAQWQQGTKCDISLSCNPDGSSIGLRKAKTPGIQGVF